MFRMNRVKAICRRLFMYQIESQGGQSLIQVVISIGVLSMVVLALLTSQVAGQRENKALSEKLASSDLTRVVTAYLANPTTCSAMFAPENLVHSSDMSFNASELSATKPYKLALKRLPGGTSAPPIATAGTQISPLSNSLFLLPATPNGANPPGIEVIVTSLTSATLKLNVDQNRLVRSLTPIQFPISIQTTGATNSTTITGCSMGGSGNSDWVCNINGNSCVRPSDGKVCFQHLVGPNTLAWVCGTPTGWPKGGNWTCAMSSNPTCVNTIDGSVCTTAPNTDCNRGSGGCTLLSPPLVPWDCFTPAGWSN